MPTLELSATKMSTLATVQEIKTSLAKELPIDDNNLSSESLERCRDMLNRLDECDVTMEILSSTLIGTVVSKFKAHSELGPIAKGLVKKWKKLAKEAGIIGKPKAVSESSNRSISSASSGRGGGLERADSTASAGSSLPANVEDEWAGLPPLRKNICSKLYQVLGISKKEMIKDGFNESAISQLCSSRASEVEAAIDKQCGKERSAYTSKARSLCFNVKKNAALRQSILMGSTSATDLVNMSSEDLATAEKSQQRANLVARAQDSRRLDWEQANETKINDMCGIKGDLLQASLFTCGRCKSIKTTSTQKQTRSADEPMTVFVLCMNCGNRWKC